MSEKINWTLSAQVVGGPKISVAKTTEVEAYDKIHIEIAPGAVKTKVDIQPSEGSGQVTFLLINADKYGDKLSYQVNADDASDVIMDGPHFLIGKGAAGLLDPANAPHALFFSNATEANGGAITAVDILVGRDATP